MSSQKKRRASAAPAPPAGPAPLLVVSFAGKGGIGKTTQSHLIASGLVRKGHTVLMIDADRQGNLTTVNAQRQVVTLEESAAEEEESVIVKAHAATGEEKKDAEPPKRAEQKAAEKMKDLTEATFFHALETGPGIDLYNMYDATTASLASDAPSMSMRQLLGGATPADVHTCWQDLMQPMPPSVKRMKAKLRRAIVRVPQGGDGDGEGDGEGDGDRAKLWLLRGSSSLGDLAIALHQHHQGASLNITPHSLQAMGAFRRMALLAADIVAADVVIVDVGPSDDAINCNIVMSCDVVQPSARPDTFSWTSILRLLLNFLPRWMKLWRVVQQQASKQLDAMTTLAPQFPYLFPTIVGQFLTDKGRDVVMTRSHASIVHGMTRSIKLAVYLSFELARDGYTDKHMLELAQDLKLLSEEAAAEEEAAEEETEAEEAEEEAAEEAEEEADTEDEGDDDASEKFPHLPELAPRVKEDLDTMRLWLRRDNGGNERAYAPEARCLLEQHCAFETQALNIAERVKLDAKLGLGCDSELGPPVLPLLPTLKYQSMAGEAGCALWDLPDVLRAAASGENKKPNASQLRAIQTEGDKLMDRFEPLLQVYVLLLQARKNSAKPAADKGNVAAGDSAGPSHKKQKQ